jgi:3-dehydroquinate synthase
MENVYMCNALTVHLNDEPIYDIFFANDFNSLPELLAGQGIADRRVCIVTESNVAPLYLDEIRTQLDGKCKELISIIFEAGESQKNLDTVKMIYEKLILAKFDRKDLLVALGGGVTGDITGFTAATYLRGIDFVQIPTSLLAQVDSSIGGKTGVDFDSYKNMVGAFHMPKLVYINVSTLTTLSDEQFISGMGEIIKHGLIKDSAYFDWLIENHDRILARDKDVLMEMIRVSCNIKRVVVENDPTEKGDRALLNFGHTLGHAIERYLDLKLSHGACVGIGCCLASVISYNRGDITEDELHKIIHAFDMFGFPTLEDHPVDADAVIEYTKNDKKMVGGKIKFILLHTIGDAYINTDVVPDDMKKAFEWH